VRERGAPFRNPLVVASNPAREEVWSGRWDLNPRQLAWEARTLPLSYARSLRYVRHLGMHRQHMSKIMNPEVHPNPL
jgi:hypothetical protein